MKNTIFTKAERRILEVRGFKQSGNRLVCGKSWIEKIDNNRYCIEYMFATPQPNWTGHSQPACTFEKLLDVISTMQRHEREYEQLNTQTK